MIYILYGIVETQSLQYNYNKPQTLNHLPERDWTQQTAHRLYSRAG